MAGRCLRLGGGRGPRPEVQQRISKLDEAAGWLTWLFVRPTEFDEKSWSKAMVKGRAADRVLDEVIAALDGDDFSDGRIEQIVLGVAMRSPRRSMPG